MTVQTFNPTSLPQSTTNWAVAQRIVGPFAPHAQVVPNLAIMLDPGYLLNGTTLTEVNAQIVGPFSPPYRGLPRRPRGHRPLHRSGGDRHRHSQ